MPQVTPTSEALRSETQPGLLLVGGGGHCCSVIDVLETLGLPIGGIVHGPDCALESLLHYPALGRDADLPELRRRFDHALVTVGQIKSPRIRQRLFTLLQELDFCLPPIVSPQSVVSARARLGEGSIVMHRALVNSGAVIGNNCIVNSGALIEHDCHIGDHCHIAVSATLCGEVRVGSGSFVGAGAVIREGISIGKNCIVGMHCGLRRDLKDNEIYVE